MSLVDLALTPLPRKAKKEQKLLKIQMLHKIRMMINRLPINLQQFLQLQVQQLQAQQFGLQ
ncbi:MAG: hypothetical protein CMD86_03540 [Gammaproteobacteria bacterium]|nr:hypothetical protein [Gammaproteobacteria bacterium]